MDAGTSAAFVLPTPEIGYQRPGLPSGSPAPLGPSRRATPTALPAPCTASRAVPGAIPSPLCQCLAGGTLEGRYLLIAARQPQNRVRGVRPDEIHKINHRPVCRCSQLAQHIHRVFAEISGHCLCFLPGGWPLVCGDFHGSGGRQVKAPDFGSSTGRAVDRSKAITDLLHPAVRVDVGFIPCWHRPSAFRRWGALLMAVRPACRTGQAGR